MGCLAASEFRRRRAAWPVSTDGRVFRPKSDADLLSELDVDIVAAEENHDQEETEHHCDHNEHDSRVEIHHRRVLHNGSRQSSPQLACYRLSTSDSFYLGPGGVYRRRLLS